MTLRSTLVHLVNHGSGGDFSGYMKMPLFFNFGPTLALYVASDSKAVRPGSIISETAKRTVPH